MKALTANILLVFVTGVLAEDGYFWHMTDHHYDTTYWSQMRSCNDEVPVRGIYGDYWCDSPWRLVNDSIGSMANIKRDVDFILWTGDNVPHIKDEYLNETYNMDILRAITDVTKREFPGVKVYATMGNHDWYPNGQFPVSTHRLYNETADLWKDWIVDPIQVANFRKGAYYTVKTSYGLRILGLNTNLYYTSNKLTKDIDDPLDQLAWMVDVFRQARAAREKVLLTAHIPPGIHNPGSVMWYYHNFNTRFTDILRANADLIVGSFFGHEHYDVLRHLKRTDGSPGVAMYMAPSITPWRFKIPGKTGKPHNPGIRLVKYDRTSSLPLDIHQYYMDLVESNRFNSSSWKLAYRTSEAYSMQDLSAVSLDNAIKNLGSNKELLNTYLSHLTLLANGDTTAKECDEACRADVICSLDNLQWSTFDSCVKALLVSGTSRLSSSSLLFTLTAIFSFLWHQI